MCLHFDDVTRTHHHHLYTRAMATEEENVNAYELLKLETEATEQEIKTAYRKLSLKVHPDRVSYTMSTSTTLVSSSFRTPVSDISMNFPITEPQ